MCIGLPVGMAWALVGIDLGTGLSPVWQVVAAGFSSSGWCWAMRVIMARLGEDEL